MHVTVLASRASRSTRHAKRAQVGFFPQRQDDEMAYSVVARARAILFPEYSVKYACKRLIGDSDYSVGGLIPNNCRLLKTRVPRISGVTDETFIEGSIYHIIAPLLTFLERSELRKSILEENARGQRGLIRRPGIRGQPLRYCVICARKDSSIGRPQIWRIVHNFPGVNCCDGHACLLVTTDAVLSPHNIHAPGDWIRIDGPVPTLACGADQRFASDVRWIYEQRSSILPGSQRLGLVLRKALLRSARYVDSKGKLSAINIANDLGMHRESTVTRLDPALLCPGTRPVLRETMRYSLARYSLLASLAGISIEEVFRLAMAEPESPNARPGTDPVCARLTRIDNARRRLEGIVAHNPSATRTEIIAKDAAAVHVVRRHDSAGYESVMPSRRRRGRNSSFNWETHDLAVHAKITETDLRSHLDARSIAAILERCGYSQRLFEKARGRLPRSKLLVASLVDNFRRGDRGQIHFRFHFQTLQRALPTNLHQSDTPTTASVPYTEINQRYLPGLEPKGSPVTASSSNRPPDPFNRIAERDE